MYQKQIATIQYTIDGLVMLEQTFSISIVKIILSQLLIQGQGWRLVDRSTEATKFELGRLDIHGMHARVASSIFC